MSMFFMLRNELSGLIGGFTSTADETPGINNPEYIAWNEFPCDPPFASMDDAAIRAPDYVGMILSEEGVLSPAPPPVPQYGPNMSVLVFRDRFTLAEKTSIYSIADTDPVMRVIIDDLNSAEYVSVDDQQTIDGVDYMISVDAVDASRRETILAPAIQNPDDIGPY